MTTITHSAVVTAPFSGKLVPLSSVPDETFASGVLGEGIAIEPSDGLFCSPVSGTVESIAETRHAIGFAGDNGLEILVHVGLETVGLKGEGFEILVKEGDTVKEGQPVAKVDLDLIRARGLNTITSIVLTGGADDMELNCAEGIAAAGKTPVLTLTAKEAQPAEAAEAAPAAKEASAEKPKKKSFINFDFLQKLGKVLMTVIAVMPAAGLMISLGKLVQMGGGDIAAVMTIGTTMENIGWAVINNLHILFAVAIGGSWAKERAGGAFAGNPYFISLDELVKEGVLTAEECKKAKFGRKADDIDYSQLYKERGRLLRLAYSRSDIGHNEAFAAFCEKNKWWLDDFALFMAVKGRFEGKPWIEWAEDIRLRWQNAMDYYRRELYFEVEYYKYLQFKFDQQWRTLKAYANEKGIRIIGDIPIYVALDSADAWANPQMFQLDEDNIPTAVAGVPPDGFSPTGQLWGNPLYRWEKHRETGYQWWITRLWYCFELYDVVRIDHFRGFDEYFSIPYGSETAAPGHWEKGPGIELFRAVEQALGKREIIAEDLGYMSETVRQLVQDSGFPGMKVLEFAFDSRDTGSASDYLPHNYPVNSVAYTGTHDNETLVSWYQTITSAERTLVRDYLYDYTTPETQLYKSMIALIFRSAAATCIIPMQDWLGLDNSARINKPSTVGENWRWRLKKSQLTPKLQKEICNITTRYGRMNWA